MKSRFLDPCTGSIHTPSLSGSVLGPGDPAVTRTVLCPVQPAHHWERPRLKLTAPRSGAKLLPARSLNAFLVTAGALQTDPCPQGGTQMRRTRVKKKKKKGGQPRRTPQRPPLSASLRPATRPRPGRRLRLSPLRGGRPAKHFQTCLDPIPECEAIPLAHAAGGPFI